MCATDCACFYCHFCTHCRLQYLSACNSSCKRKPFMTCIAWNYICDMVGSAQKTLVFKQKTNCSFSLSCLLLLTLNSIQNAKLCMTPFTISTSQVKIPHKKMLCVISTWRLTTSALDAKAIDKHHGKMVRRLLRSDYNYVIRCKNTRYKYME